MTSPTPPSAALDPMVQELIVAAMDLQECQRTSTARELSSKMNDLSRQLTERMVKPQYSLDAGYLKVEMAKVGITDEDQAANAARIVLAALTPAPPVSVPADQRQRTIDSLNTSIETWAESTGRRDDPVKSTGGMFFDPAETTFGEYAWNRMNAVPANHVAVSREDIHKRIYDALDQLPYLMVPKVTMTANEYIKRIATDITAALAADQTDAG